MREAISEIIDRDCLDGRSFRNLGMETGGPGDLRQCCGLPGKLLRHRGGEIRRYGFPARHRLGYLARHSRLPSGRNARTTGAGGGERECVARPCRAKAAGNGGVTGQSWQDSSSWLLLCGSRDASILTGCARTPTGTSRHDGRRVRDMVGRAVMESRVE